MLSLAWGKTALLTGKEEAVSRSISSWLQTSQSLFVEDPGGVSQPRVAEGGPVRVKSVFRK